MKNYYKFAVIGGGPAGSLTALLLRKEGHDVHLFERSNYPLKNKVCGEYLCPAGMKLMEKIGLEGLIAKYPKIYGMKIFSPKEKEVDTYFPNNSFGCAVSRDELDNELLDLCMQAGVKVQFQTSIDFLGMEKNKIVLKSKDQIWHADYIIGADGRQSMVAKWMEVNIPFENNRVAIHAYVDGKFVQTEKLQGQMHILNDGSYCGLNPVKTNQWNFSIVCDAGKINQFGSKLDLLKEEVRTHYKLKDIIDLSNLKNEQIKVISAITHPVTNITDFQKRSFLVGDASGFVDPLTGEGMYHAFLSAKILTKLIQEQKSLDEVFVKYEKQMALLYQNKVRINYFFQWVIKVPLICELMAKFLNMKEDYRSIFIGLIGNVYKPEMALKLILKRMFGISKKGINYVNYSE
jgi:flavin-dependent dehydrogenase